MDTINSEDFTVRRATDDDFQAISTIYDYARTFMRSCGNMSQWTNGYPAPEDTRRDAERGELYVLCCGGDVAAVFCMMTRPEPTYGVIYGGEWIKDGPYATVHRIAVSDRYRGRGCAALCFGHASKIFGNVRADTHRDNAPMQRALEKNGFVYCGIIHLANGDERLAYQLIITPS